MFGFQFIFIEPEGSPQPPVVDEDLRHDSLNSRASMQRNLFQHEDPMLLAPQRLLNPELLSNGSYSSPSTQSAPMTNQTAHRASSSGPKINRNYLQVQANSYRASVANRGRLGTSQNDINTLATSNGSEPKRTRSISRSVRNLFTGSKSRDKSYDSGSMYNSNNINYDVASGRYNKHLFIYISVFVCTNPYLHYPIYATIRTFSTSHLITPFLQRFYTWNSFDLTLF